MSDLKIDRKCLFYKCGRCSGNIRYTKQDGIPDICPECGYGHKTRRVNDIPSDLRLNLNAAGTDSGSRGITEKTTITSR